MNPSPHRRVRTMVPVPPEVRRAACTLHIELGQQGMANHLHVSVDHALDLIAPGAIISEAVLERVKARLGLDMPAPNV